MINYYTNKSLLNKLLGRKLQLVANNGRGYIDASKHYEPKNLNWQWRVRKDPEDRCPKLCVSKQCPKKSWFPKLKKVYVSKDIESCVRRKKPMTWGEYFSYLLPDKYQKSKPDLVSCKKLIALRREKCAEPYSIDCLKTDWHCYPVPGEWRGQGVLKAAISCRPPTASPDAVPSPCPPPAHMLPRCVMVKKGICPVKGKTSSDMEDHRVKLPYYEFKEASRNVDFLAEKPFQLKSSKICRRSIPVGADKSAKLTCGSYGGLKSVECPDQLYTRYKSVDVPPATCEELRPLKPVPASCFGLPREKLKGARSSPQVRGYHKTSWASDRCHGQNVDWRGVQNWQVKGVVQDISLQPSKSVVKVKELRKFKDFGSPIKLGEPMKFKPTEGKKLGSMKEVGNRFGTENLLSKQNATPVERKASMLHTDTRVRPDIQRREISTRSGLGVKRFHGPSSCGPLLKRAEKDEQVCEGPKHWVKQEHPANPRLKCRMRVAKNYPTDKEQAEASKKSPYQACRQIIHSPCNKPRKPKVNRTDEPYPTTRYNSKKYHTEASDSRYMYRDFHRMYDFSSTLVRPISPLGYLTKWMAKLTGKVKSSGNSCRPPKPEKKKEKPLPCEDKTQAPPENPLNYKKKCAKAEHEKDKKPDIFDLSDFDPYTVKRLSCFEAQKTDEKKKE